VIFRRRKRQQELDTWAAKQTLKEQAPRAKYFPEPDAGEGFRLASSMLATLREQVLEVRGDLVTVVRLTRMIRTIDRFQEELRDKAPLDVRRP
jgi:hypothetical protein